MKKIFYLLIPILLTAGCSSKPQFLIKARIEGSDNVKFMLFKRSAGSFVVLDSAISRNGQFQMKGSVKYPEMVVLMASEKNQRVQFFLENAKIAISGKIDSVAIAKVTGSKTQDEYQSYISSDRQISKRGDDKYLQYQAANQSGDTASVRKLRDELNSISDELTQLKKDFIKNNPGSYFTPLLIADISPMLQVDELEADLNILDTNVAKVDYVSTLKEQVKVMKTVAVGQKAPDFTMNDVDDKPVTLSSKVGSKLLLIDFWAGWCGPCRRENPNVVKIFNEFHKKGLDIIGISLDQTKEVWTRAIKDDKLTWTQVSDLRYWENAAAKLYAVTSIPSNFLLDDKGIIIARNLRGETLYNKVKEILGK